MAVLDMSARVWTPACEVVCLLQAVRRMMHLSAPLAAAWNLVQ